MRHYDVVIIFGGGGFMLMRHCDVIIFGGGGFVLMRHYDVVILF